ncbi:DUF1499 domain-containing protein [Jannaschia pohangensis]|uniref:DUF1499 domain-containing protein n=1 Tax=Jannaschia pohangensis TaxID=390807 RepID=A0A1I3IH67_9RHOB|nr:DUF1499 domain-containing protein [Jannaschia pohangensis]SFI47338.1 Protein of unknown function [Jannaschia pohangensis]
MKRTLLLAALAAAIAGMGYVRLAPMDAAEWHVDPEGAERTGKPNDYMIGPGGDRDAVVLDGTTEDVMARLDAVAMAEPGTTRLAGSPDEGWVTYVQRSRLMGYPDAITVKAVPTGERTGLILWSRSRYGQSDLGVNRARLERWLTALGA